MSGLEVTIFAYRQPSTVPVKPPTRKGYGWAALEVQVCVRDGTFTASWEPWSLVYSDGGTALAQRPAGTTETPPYPDDRKPLPAGACVRGWVMFAVPDGGRPAMVEFQPRDSVANWTVPAA